MSLVTSDTLVLVDLLVRGPAPTHRIIARFDRPEGLALSDGAVRRAIEMGRKAGHIIGECRLTSEGIAVASHARQALQEFLRSSTAQAGTRPIGASLL